MASRRMRIVWGPGAAVKAHRLFHGTLTSCKRALHTLFSAVADRKLFFKTSSATASPLLATQSLADGLGVPVIFRTGQQASSSRQPGSQPVIGPAGPDAWRHPSDWPLQKRCRNTGWRKTFPPGDMPLLIQRDASGPNMWAKGLDAGPAAFPPVDSVSRTKPSVSWLPRPKGSGDPPSPLGFFLPERAGTQIIIGFVDGDDRPGSPPPLQSAYITHPFIRQKGPSRRRETGGNIPRLFRGRA